jgi:hypothetical protein
MSVPLNAGRTTPLPGADAAQRAQVRKQSLRVDAGHRAAL